MQYEIYIDVFFLVNFMMDYLVLTTLNKVLKYHATYKKIFLGSVLGALLVSAFICLPFSRIFKFICLQFLVQLSMLEVTFKIRDIKEFIKSVIAMYFVSFLYGGVISWFRQYIGSYMKLGSLFFCIVVVTYFLVDQGMVFWEHLWKIRDKMCSVTIIYKSNSISLHAMIDSGNELYDLITGKPVHIIDRDAIKKLTSKEKICKIRYITYHTVQDNEAIMPIIEVDSMRIHNGLEKYVDRPLLGISERDQFGDGAYDIILHSKDC